MAGGTIEGLEWRVVTGQVSGTVQLSALVTDRVDKGTNQKGGEERESGVKHKCPARWRLDRNLVAITIMG